MSEKIQLGSLNLDTNALQNKLDSTINQIRDLDKAIFDQQASLKETSSKYNEAVKVLNELEKAGKSNTAEYRTAQKEVAEYGKKVIEARGDLRDLTSQLSEAKNENKKYQSALNDLSKAQTLIKNGYSAESKSIEELNEDRKLLIQLAERERSVNGELSESHKQLNKYLDENAEAIGKLKANSEKDGFSKLSESANQFGESLSGIRDGLGQIASGNISGGIDQLKGSFKSLLASATAFLATPIGAAIAALAGLVIATKYLYDYNAEMSRTTQLVKEFTGLQGEALDSLAVKVKTFSDQTGEDMGEITRTVNAFANAFGVSHAEAFDKVRAGYIQVGKSAEDFFDNTSEYAGHFKDAGFTANEFFGIMKAGTQDGVYKDKLTDGIKELDIRLKDLSKTGREALENAFGKTFTDKLVSGISSGAITTKEALQMISSEAKTVGLNQEQMAKLTANVFGSMGEEAFGFVKVLQSVENGLENAANGLDPLQKKIEESMEVQEEFNQVFASLFMLSGDGFASMQADMKTMFFQTLTQGIKKVIELTNSFIDTYNQSMALRVIVGSIGAAMKTQVTIAISALKLLWNGLTSLGSLLSGILTLDVEKMKQAFADGFQGIADIAEYAFNSVKDNINDVVNMAQNGKLAKIDISTSTVNTTTNVEDNITKEKASTVKAGDNSKELEKAQKEAEKKRKIAEDTLNKELELRLKYAEQLAQLEAQELANKIANSQSLIDEEKRLTQSLVDEEKNRLDLLKSQRDQLNQEELNNKLNAITNEEAMESARLQKLVDDDKLTKEQMQLTLDEFLALTQQKRDMANEEYRVKEAENILLTDEAKKEVQAELDEQDLADQELKRELELEEMYIRLEEDGQNKYEIEKQINDAIYAQQKTDLDNQYATGKINEENYQLALTNIKKQHAQQEKAINDAKINETLSATSSMFGTMKGLFKENSAAHKAMAIGEAVINTYLGVTAALAQSPPASYIMAATTLASGLAAVAKIVSTKGKSLGGANTSMGLSTGGYTGDDSTFSRAGYLPVHGGEVVFSRADVNAMGGVAGVEAMRPTSSQFMQQALAPDVSMYEMISTAVRDGSFAGTQSGTTEGIKQNNINQKIKDNATY